MAPKRKLNEIKSSYWDCPAGRQLALHRSIANRAEFPSGCGVATLSRQELKSLRSLCNSILKRLQGLVPWGDGWTDKKKRGYGMLARHSNWKDVRQLTDSGILFHDADAYNSNEDIRKSAVRKHNLTVRQSFASVEPSGKQLEVINKVIVLAKNILQSAVAEGKLKPYEWESLSLSDLVAIQPNLHNGDDYLPLHVDNPRHDGFGVVIVTVALWGSADVILVDEGDPEPEQEQAERVAGSKTAGAVVDACTSTATAAPLPPGNSSSSKTESWAFPLHPGQLYVLGGYARNKCAHGVAVLSEQQGELAHSTTSTATVNATDSATAADRRHSSCGQGRVSLNFRFGLHTAAQAWEDIDRHWG